MPAPQAASADLRARMVQAQIERRGVHDERVLEAIRTVPRERFVDAGYEEFAYDDHALPVGDDLTISQPYVVALMLECAEIRPGDRVLEVGAGSGYAAAVASRMVGAGGGRVYALEPDRDRVHAAWKRIEALGYGDVVDLRAGDGSQGWPEAAPFDVILVSAGGPGVPQALRDQLAPGGRLVIPVGEARDSQRLLKLTRNRNGGGGDDFEFETEDIGGARFVPAIPTAEDGRRAASHPLAGASPSRTLPQMIAEAAEPLPEDFDDPAFAAAFDRYADRKVVLLGECSHGTSEFHRARAAITRRLIGRHGFTLVAVEADWPDAASIDRHVRPRPAGPRSETRRRSFERFPTWMWRNTDVAAFVEWLGAHNQGRGPRKDRAGFFGLDLYNMNGSIAAVLEYLESVDPDAARIARDRYGCLTPWQKDPATYGRAVLSQRYRTCEEPVLAQCRALLEKQLDYACSELDADGDEFLDATQNARLVASAERYYRVMYYGGTESWNLRDTHMFETLQHLLESRGPHAKAVVWAHNSHIGDARHTEMGAIRHELNIGQLCRETYGDETALIGLGTNTGTVAAAADWGEAMEVMRVRPALKDSVEALCHEAGVPRFLLDLGAQRHPALRRRLIDQSRPERFIGVIYRPQTERLSHYADVSVAEQFDAYVWFDQTSAVTPLRHGPPPAGVPETWPFAV